MKKISDAMKWSVFLMLFSVLGGCASPAAVGNMSVYASKLQTPVALKDSIAVAEVTGGRETNPMWVSQVSSEAFRSALEDSLMNAGMFSRVLAASKYRLIADLSKLDQPMFGLDLMVTSSVKYSVIDMKTNKEVYSRMISAPFTATFADSPLAVTRLRIANEGSVKKNIEMLIADLVALKTD